MIVCTKCGRQNEESAEFCKACGAFLEWTGREAEKPISSVTLSVTPAVMTVEPGEEVSCDVHVVNTGSIVDRFLIELPAEVESWTTVEPPVVHVFPGSEGTARVTFRPPKSPKVLAGPISFTLGVRSSVVEGGRTFEQHCHITVSRFTALDATIAPRTSEAVEAAVHTLMVSNAGNTQAQIELRGVDPDERLTFEFEPGSHIIEPAGSVASRLRVSRRTGVSRPNQRFPFQVEVTHAGGPSIFLDAALVQQRPAEVARWAWQPWAVTIASLVLLAVVGGVLGMGRIAVPGSPVPIRSGTNDKAIAPPTAAPPATQRPVAPPAAVTQPPTAPPQPPPAPPKAMPVSGPQWSGWNPLPSGGTTNVAAAVTTYQGKLYMFGIGIDDHNHYVNAFGSSGWSGWAQMARGLPSTASDAAVAYNGKLYVFAIDMYDQHHYVDVFDGSNWNGWNQVPGGGTSNVSDSVAAYNGKLYLFGVGINDHRHYMDVFDGAGWSGWGLVPGGGTTTSSDTAIAYNGKLFLFSVGSGTHYLNAFDGSSWSGWNPVPGGGTTNLSDAAAVYNNQLFLFGIGISDHGQWVDVFDGSNWSGWKAVPGGAGSRSYDAASIFNNSLYLVEIGYSDQHYYVNIMSG